jgi:hypothetical protein
MLPGSQSDMAMEKKTQKRFWGRKTYCERMGLGRLGDATF